MITYTDYPLTGTAYRYRVHFYRPSSAHGNIYCVVATLIALSHPLHPPQDLPLLNAWGRHDVDARENLEGELRAWLLSPPASLPPPRLFHE